MFEAESVPSSNNASYLLLVIPGIMFKIQMNDRVQNLLLQTSQSDPLSIRN